MKVRFSRSPKILYLDEVPFKVRNFKIETIANCVRDHLRTDNEIASRKIANLIIERRRILGDEFEIEDDFIEKVMKNASNTT